MTPIRAGALVVIVLSILLVPLRASALFGGSASVGNNSFSTATLLPPTGLGASPACNGTAPEVSLSWTASSSSFADGYVIYRSATAGGTRSNVGSVTGRTTVTFVDTAVTLNTTYYYAVISTGRGWTSVESGEASATVAATCP